MEGFISLQDKVYNLCILSRGKMFPLKFRPEQF